MLCSGFFSFWIRFVEKVNLEEVGTMVNLQNVLHLQDKLLVCLEEVKRT